MNGVENIAPVPLPGECIYSIAAAFARRWFRGRRQGALLLFNGATPCARDVPARLPQLSSNLPQVLGLTAEQLALRHTSLPVHFPFVDAQRRVQLLHDVVAGKAMQLKLGLAPSKLVSPRALRICPDCLREDQTRCGRAYWHREHQLPGALVCPWHHVPLSTTSVRPEAVHGSVIFVSPTQATIVAEERLADSECRIADRVSRALAELLAPGIPCPGPARLHACYRQKLTAAGYGQPNHTIAIARLRADIVRFYGSHLLRQLACSIPHNYGWLASLVRKPRAHVQPLRHVVLMTFIGTVPDVLADAASIEPSKAESQEHPHRIRTPARLKMLRPLKRLAWLQALKSNRSGSVRDAEGALYGWLWRNDRVWLGRHRNPSPKRVPDLRAWTKRDNQLAARITRVAQTIKRMHPWHRASRTLIASRCGAAGWLVRDHPHLPKAVAAIKTVTETPIAFAVRRLKELAKNKHLQAAPPWRLRVKAGISVALAQQPPVSRLLRTISKMDTNHGHELR